MGNKKTVTFFTNVLHLEMTETTLNGEGYCRRLGALLLCLSDVFRALIKLRSLLILNNGLLLLLRLLLFYSFGLLFHSTTTIRI